MLWTTICPECVKRKSGEPQLLRAGVLGDGLGSFGNSVLGKLSRKNEADSGLDLSRRKGRLAVEAAELSGFGGDALENVSDEGVHNRHTTAGDTRIRVNLLQHLVDVSRVRFDSLLAALGHLGLFALLGRGLSGFGLGRHV